MSSVHFVTPSASSAVDRSAWEPVLVKKAEIDGEIQRLLDEARPESGLRTASIVHPRATDGVPSFTPVTEISINVLKPGERTPVRRGNFSLLETGITGSGTVHAGKEMSVAAHDVWTVPSMQPYYYENSGAAPWAWLSYSNSALLRRTGTYWAEDHPKPKEVDDKAVSADLSARYNRKTAPIHDLPSTGAELRAYEYLTDIDPLPNPAQHWAFTEIEPHFPQTPRDNDPSKRTIWLLYNPATERRQGTTPVHFATYSGVPAGTAPYAGTRGHFHISASVNYHVRGHGYSIVEGKRYDWGPGDLLFSAPSWQEHAHYLGGDAAVVLTVQDHPMHISMGSLLWQEDINQPILSLGTDDGQKGFVHPRQTGT